MNPESRREVLLRLTPPGRRIVDEVTARRQELITAVVIKMTARDRAGLVRAFRAFAAAGGEPSAEPGERERDRVPLGWD